MTGFYSFHKTANGLYVFFHNTTHQPGILINIVTFVLRVAVTHMKVLRLTDSPPQLLDLLKDEISGKNSIKIDNLSMKPPDCVVSRLQYCLVKKAPIKGDSFFN